MESLVWCKNMQTGEEETLYYPDVKVFGKKLKKLRQSRKLTIKELSDQIGWWHWCIDEWENGSPVCGDTLRQLADYFNVSADYLLSAEMNEFEQLTLF